jgi:hypothetical protein
MIPERGIEEVIVQDEHGRVKHIQASILSGPDPEKFIQAEIAEFAAQERKLARHKRERFDAQTLERKKSRRDDV